MSFAVCGSLHTYSRRWWAGWTCCRVYWAITVSTYTFAASARFLPFISMRSSPHYSNLTSFIVPFPSLWHDVALPHIYGLCIRLYARCIEHYCKGGGHIDSKKKRKHQLHKELRAYAKAGLKLWLDGEPSTPSDIVRQCMICEEGEYMRDFVSNDDKNIIGIGFDHIKIK